LNTRWPACHNDALVEARGTWLIEESVEGTGEGAGLATVRDSREEEYAQALERREDTGGALVGFSTRSGCSDARGGLGGGSSDSLGGLGGSSSESLGGLGGASSWSDMACDLGSWSAGGVRVSDSVPPARSITIFARASVYGD
jgi:hypothetical protein